VDMSMNSERERERGETHERRRKCDAKYGATRKRGSGTCLGSEEGIHFDRGSNEKKL
jgi:hypothetical protein